MNYKLLSPPVCGLLFCGCALAFAWETRGQIVLNEIMAANRASVANAGEYPDWVEFYNASDQPVDLGGMSFSNDPEAPRKFVFPANTVVGPRGYLVVWCDSSVTSPGLHTGFRISASGAILTLYDTPANSSRVRDSVTFGLQLEDRTLGRIPNGIGAWQLNGPTPAQENEPQTLGPNTGLKINEWMAVNPEGDDWFELFNSASLPVSLGGIVLSDAINSPINRPIPSLSFIAANGFIQIMADDLESLDADHVDFRLASSGETLTIFASNRSTIIDRVTFGAQSSGVSQGRLPDGANTIVSLPGRPTPGSSNFQLLTGIVINEALSHTDLPFEDAIELHNPTRGTIDISHWWLSNSKSEPKKFRIPPGAVIPSGGFKVFYENQFNPSGTGESPSFTLNSARGDQVFLSTGDSSGNLTGQQASVSFGPAENGVSFGRHLASTGPKFVALSATSFGKDAPSTVAEFRTGAGAANTPPKIGPIVFNEIMYHPPEIVVGADRIDNTLDEYLELLNITSSPVLLYDPASPTNTWRIADGVEFEFPESASLAPGGTLLVVNFNPATNATQLAAFRLKHRLSTRVPIFGPLRGKLANSGETIELRKPDRPQLPPHPDAGLVPYVVVEKVTYSDTAPWPTQPDGSGAVLQRIDPALFGDDPANWTSAAPTPGKPEANLAAPAIQSANIQNGQLILEFQALAGQTYTVQFSDSLSNPDWQKLSVSDVSAGASDRLVTVTDLQIENPTRFYRIVSP